MLERDAARPLAGLIQIDNAYRGGRRRGYKRGRGTRGKAPIVAAVQQTDAQGRPQRMSFNRVRAFRSREIERWSRARLATGSTVRSDGLRCFKAVSQAGCERRPTVMRGPGTERRRKRLH